MIAAPAIQDVDELRARCAHMSGASQSAPGYTGTARALARQQPV